MVAIVLGIIRVIPRMAGLRLMRALGFVLYYLMPERRRVAMTNLAIAFGADMSASRKTWIARESFQNSMALIFDFLKVPQLSPEVRESFVEVEGEENLKQALALGRGVLAVSAHYGNFLLLLCVLGLKGYPLHVVTRHFRSQRTEGVYTAILARFRVWTFPRRHEAANILKALKNGAIVGYVLDQNMRRENGIFVDFFGRSASTIKGLATLAGRYGSPILPVCIVSTPDGRHHIHIGQAMLPESSREMKARELELTQHYTTLIEGWIRRRPEQWLWAHRRFKTRPDGDPPIYPPRRAIKTLLKQWRRRKRAS